MTSCRTGGAAVAVRASRVGRPDRLRLGAEPHVVGAEVAAPLADQVGFIDDEQAGPGPLQRLTGLLVRQLLGREEDERAGIAGLKQGRGARARRLLRVEHDGRQARRPQVGELVILEGDQRREDDRRPFAKQAGQLVDRGLAAAGRQHGQHVAAVDQRLHRGQLPRTKLVEAEALPGEPLDHRPWSLGCHSQKDNGTLRHSASLPTTPLRKGARPQEPAPVQNKVF